MKLKFLVNQKSKGNLNSGLFLSFLLILTLSFRISAQDLEKQALEIILNEGKEQIQTSCHFYFRNPNYQEEIYSFIKTKLKTLSSIDSFPKPEEDIIDLITSPDSSSQSLERENGSSTNPFDIFDIYEDPYEEKPVTTIENDPPPILPAEDKVGFGLALSSPASLLNCLIWNYVKGIESSSSNFKTQLQDLTRILIETSKENLPKEDSRFLYFLSNLLEEKRKTLGEELENSFFREPEKNYNDYFSENPFIREKNKIKLLESVIKYASRYLRTLRRKPFFYPQEVVSDFIVQAYEKMVEQELHVSNSPSSTILRPSLLAIIDNNDREIEDLSLLVLSQLIKNKKIILPLKELNKHGSSPHKKMKWNINASFKIGACGAGSSYEKNFETDGVNHQYLGGGCNYEGGYVSSISDLNYTVSSTVAYFPSLFSTQYSVVAASRLLGGIRKIERHLFGVDFLARDTKKSQTSSIDFTIRGNINIHACNNIEKCSPIIEVRRNRNTGIYYTDTPDTLPTGSVEAVTINQIPLEEEALILDRSEKNISIEISSSRKAIHVGGDKDPSQSGQSRMNVEVIRREADFEILESHQINYSKVYQHLYSYLSSEDDRPHPDISYSLVAFMKGISIRKEDKLIFSLSALLLLHESFRQIYENTLLMHSYKIHKKSFLRLYRQYLSHKTRELLILEFQSYLDKQRKDAFSQENLQNISRIISETKLQILESPVNILSFRESINDIMEIGVLNPILKDEINLFSEKVDNLAQSKRQKQALLFLLVEFENNFLAAVRQRRNELKVLQNILAQIADER